MHDSNAETRARGLVLVVDDSPQILSVMCEILGEEHDVIFASSGAEALALARSESPDLILLDVIMPEMDGYAVCAHLKEHLTTKDIPVLFITGQTDARDEGKGLELGAIDYIHKPVNPPLVKVRVRNHMELKQGRDALKGLSYTDALTGLANRRRFDGTLEMAWQRSMRSQRPVSMLMVDVDHFKRYNDHLGHGEGDVCLRKVAQALQSIVQRTDDLMARFGGEEFACVLPDTEMEGALRIAELAKAAVQSLSLPHPASPVAQQVTVSIGVSTLVADVGTPQALLIESADRALYAAKRLGRDRIETPDADPPEAVAAPAPLVKPPTPVAPSGTEEPYVLLVEDDARMAMLLAGRLEALGTRVKRVSHAQAALEEIAHSTPDLILSDVVMPGMDGFEFCKVVKANPEKAGIPFVVLTSLNRNLRERSTHAGADDYLSKLEDETVFTMRTRSLLELGLRRHNPGQAAELEPILLISASPAILMQLSAQLTAMKLQVHTAGDLQAGGDLARSLHPAVLVVDQDLGGEGCLAWIHELQKEAWSAASAVLLLASKSEERGFDGFADAADDRLPKPLDAAESRHRVGLMLRLAQARRVAQ